MDENSQIVWINNSLAAWPTFMLMLFLNFLDIYCKVHILFFQKRLIILRKSTKYAYSGVGGAVPPKTFTRYSDENSFYKQQAGHVCLLWGVNYAQHGMIQSTRIDDCCQMYQSWVSVWCPSVMHFTFRLLSALFVKGNFHAHASNSAPSLDINLMYVTCVKKYSVIEW